MLVSLQGGIASISLLGGNKKQHKGANKSMECSCRHAMKLTFLSQLDQERVVPQSCMQDARAALAREKAPHQSSMYISTSLPEISPEIG